MYVLMYRRPISMLLLWESGAWWWGNPHHSLSTHWEIPWAELPLQVMLLLLNSQGQKPESSAPGAGLAAAVPVPAPVTTELWVLGFFWENSPSWRIFFLSCGFFSFVEVLPLVCSLCFIFQKLFIVWVSYHNTSFAFPSDGDLFFPFYFCCSFRGYLEVK